MLLCHILTTTNGTYVTGKIGVVLKLINYLNKRRKKGIGFRKGGDQYKVSIQLGI